MYMDNTSLAVSLMVLMVRIITTGSCLLEGMPKEFLTAVDLQRGLGGNVRPLMDLYRYHEHG